MVAREQPDTRGIIDPAAMLQLVDFDRGEPGPVLEGLVEWFWSVAWALPEGAVHRQQVLNHPAGNISIGTIDDAGLPLDPAQGRVYGVQRGVSTRRLTGRGWTVAARTSVGGLGAILGRAAKEVADRQLTLDAAFPALPDPDIVTRVETLPTNAERCELLRDQLERIVAARSPSVVRDARDVVEAASIAEHDRSVCRVEHLARAAGVSVRSLQRSFDFHVGASPSFVIRRWRIIEAAEAAVEDADSWRGWADVAAELGYADQAHLARDFRSHLGITPSAYVARNRS